MILLENDGGNGGGGVKVPMEKMRVERSVWENEKKEKEKKWSEWASQREKMASVKMSGWEWWVVGLGGARGNLKSDLTF